MSVKQYQSNFNTYDNLKVAPYVKPTLFQSSSFKVSEDFKSEYDNMLPSLVLAKENIERNNQVFSINIPGDSRSLQNFQRNSSPIHITTREDVQKKLRDRIEQKLLHEEHLKKLKEDRLLQKRRSQGLLPKPALSESMIVSDAHRAIARKPINSSKPHFRPVFNLNKKQSISDSKKVEKNLEEDIRTSTNDKRSNEVAEEKLLLVSLKSNDDFEIENIQEIIKDKFDEVKERKENDLKVHSEKSASSLEDSTAVSNSKNPQLEKKSKKLNASNKRRKKLIIEMQKPKEDGEASNGVEKSTPLSKKTKVETSDKENLSQNEITNKNDRKSNTKISAKTNHVKADKVKTLKDNSEINNSSKPNPPIIEKNKKHLNTERESNAKKGSGTKPSESNLKKKQEDEQVKATSKNAKKQSNGIFDKIKETILGKDEEYFTESDDDTEHYKWYKNNIISSLRPINVEGEKCRFYKNSYDYNPQFRYTNPLPPEVLEKYGNASDKYIPQAIKILKNVIRKHGSYERFEEKTGGKVLSRAEIVKSVREYCRNEGYKDNEIVLNISEELLSTASMSRAGNTGILNIRPDYIHEGWIEGLLRHELGTHFNRSMNTSLQPWNKQKGRRKYKLLPQNPTEEGLASLHTVLLRHEPYLFKNALLYLTTALAAKLSFKDLFMKIGEYIHDPERRWEYCLRAKRGQHDTSKPGCFAKDQVYLTGALNILKNRKKIDFIALVKLGKVAFEDVERLKKVGELENENLRIPTFMENLKFYKFRLDQVLKLNGLKDSDFVNVSTNKAQVNDVHECRYDI